MAGVLVIDDDPSIALLARQAMAEFDLPFSSSSTAADGYAKALQLIPDVILLDVVLPDQSGLELFERLRALDTKIPIIVVTADSSSRVAIEAMRLGAFDFLVKPLQLSDLRQRIQRVIEIRDLTRVSFEIRSGTEGESRDSELLVGHCARMQDIYKSIGRLSTQDLTVLIRGETGSGKELAARVIHHFSHRTIGPFIALNCAKTAEVEAELIGEQRPGITRGDRSRPLRLQRSSGGTLFLDEVGELSLSLQSTLLNVLVDQAGSRNTEKGPADPDVRVIAASSKNLSQMLVAGQFRADLFYHLNATTIEMPPLRERLEDLPQLVNHFVVRQMQQFKKRILRLAPETLESLRKYPWPGNIRELESVLREALMNATGPVLLPEFLPALIREQPTADRMVIGCNATTTNWTSFLHAQLQANSEQIYDEALAAMERQLLTLILQHTGGHQANAAKLLGMTRTSLRSKIRALGIVIDRQIDVHAGEEAADAAEPSRTS